MKILITGGMGYVGSHLIDLLLKDKHKIVLLTKSYSKRKLVFLKYLPKKLSTAIIIGRGQPKPGHLQMNFIVILNY
mgnify:CR=1 FL=1